jgi:GNAT superfamily N-acetyltransferase
VPASRRRTREALPPGYPPDYESTARLADGRRVTIRPVLPSDAPELAEAIRTADAATLRARFLGGPPPLTGAVLDALTRVDYTNRFALVARNRGRGVGIARYAALPPPPDGVLTAEVAVAVAPHWRRVGLATLLIGLLARRAMECNISHYSAVYLADNRPVAELAHHATARVVIAHGIAQLSADLTDPALGEPPAHQQS